MWRFKLDKMLILVTILNWLDLLMTIVVDTDVSDLLRVPFDKKDISYYY